MKCNTESVAWWSEQLSGLGPQDKSQKACSSPFQKRCLETFHYRDITPCHRKGYDPVSLNCSSRLDALGFQDSQARWHKPRKEISARAGHAGLSGSLNCLPPQQSHRQLQETNLSQTQHQLLLPTATTRLWCLHELGFHDVTAFQRQIPLCPNQNWHCQTDTSDNKQWERLSRYTEIQREPTIYAKSW